MHPYQMYSSANPPLQALALSRKIKVYNSRSLFHKQLTFLDNQALYLEIILLYALFKTSTSSDEQKLNLQGFLNQGMKNFHTLIWTVRGSGGCQKSRQVNGVQVSCQHNCPVDQSICLHADMSVHRLVYLSTNINNKKHHLTSYVKKIPL